MERLVKYLEAHSLAGVGLRVVRWHRAPVGVGQMTMDAVRKQMKLESVETTKTKVEALGRKIIEEEKAAAAASSAPKIIVQEPAPSS